MLRRRAQATAEFALVFPVFIATLGALLILAMVAINVASAEGAARAGLRGGYWAMGPVNQHMALHPIISAVRGSKVSAANWVGQRMVDPTTKARYDATVYANFAARNVYDSKGVYRSRLGWDWGLIDTAQTQEQLRDVLRWSIYRAQLAAASSFAVAVGPTTTFRACFLYRVSEVCPDAASAIALPVAEAVGIEGGVDFPGEGAFWAVSAAAAAPRFLRVELKVEQVSWPMFLDARGWTWYTSAIDRLPRFEPACPLPATVAAQKSDPCGSVYYPWTP